jgi:hypothetical protein
MQIGIIAKKIGLSIDAIRFCGFVDDRAQRRIRPAQSTKIRTPQNRYSSCVEKIPSYFARIEIADPLPVRERLSGTLHILH